MYFTYTGMHLLGDQVGYSAYFLYCRQSCTQESKLLLVCTSASVENITSLYWCSLASDQRVLTLSHIVKLIIKK